MSVGWPEALEAIGAAAAYWVYSVWVVLLVDACR